MTKRLSSSLNQIYKKQPNRLNVAKICFFSENWHKCAEACTSPRFSVDKAGRLLPLPSLTPKDPGYKAPPLVNSEFFEFVVPDTLHTHFRLTDVLFSRTLDLFTKEAKASALKLCKDLGITVRLGSNGEATLSNLTLRMRKILLSEIFTESLITNSVKQARTLPKLLSVYRSFSALWDSLQGDDPLAAKRAVIQFIQSFREAFLTELTYYAHLISHYPTLMTSFGSLSKFQQQSVEQLNHRVNQKFNNMTSALKRPAVNRVEQSAVILNRIYCYSV